MRRHLYRSIIDRLSFAAIALLLALGAAACIDDALVSPEGVGPRATETPLLSLTSVSPDTALVGDTGVVLTVRGSGFDSTANVWTYAAPLVTTTFVDDSTLTARVDGQLWSAGTFDVTVFTATGASNPLPLVVANPAPVITRMTPAWCETGGSCGTITLEGRNFLPDASVQWNGGTVYATVWSDSLITFQLDPGYLQWEQRAEVNVVNPGPGGGPSATMLFQVGTRYLLHTAGATAGSGAFELEVHGELFAPGSVVYWNGSPRETTYFNERRISAWIPASDVAAPGEAVITVDSWRVYPGDPFYVGTVTVRPAPPATVASQTALELPVRGLAYSPVTRRLYGTVYQGPMAGHLAIIDPAGGMVENYLWIGDSPRYVTLSEDGRYLWVGVDGENRVRRVNLTWAYPEYTIDLDSGLVAEDLAAVPGRADQVAVARKGGCCPRHAGVAVYQAYGWQLPSATAAGVGSTVIEFGVRGATLHGMDTETPDNRMRLMAVDDGGVTLTSTGWSPGAGVDSDMVFAGGRLYTTHGRAVDTGYNDWAGFFWMEGTVRPDLETGRAFFLGEDAIRVADINTFASLGTLPIGPMNFEDPGLQRRHLVRWGTDGLAWHDADKVYLLRSPLVGQ